MVAAVDLKHDACYVSDKRKVITSNYRIRSIYETVGYIPPDAEGALCLAEGGLPVLACGRSFLWKLNASSGWAGYCGIITEKPPEIGTKVLNFRIFYYADSE